MSGLLALVAYVVGYVGTAALAMRYVATTFEHCHGESGSGYNWGRDGAYCRRNCAKTCWRTDEQITVRAVAIGSGAGLLWPLLLLPLLPLFAATRRPLSAKAVDVDRRIADLERELGMTRTT